MLHCFLITADYNKHTVAEISDLHTVHVGVGAENK